MTKTLNQKINFAVSFFGSQHKMAKKLKVSQMAVYKWLHGFSLPSAKNALKIQILTNNKIKAQDILPFYTEQFFISELSKIKKQLIST